MNKWYWLTIIMLVLSACGKPHSYEIGQCFRLVEDNSVYYKIINMWDDKYFVKLYLKDVPEEYKEWNEVLPLPDKMDYETFESKGFQPINCP